MFFVTIEAVKRIRNAKYSFYTQRWIEKQNEINPIGYLVTIRARAVTITVINSVNIIPPKKSHLLSLSAAYCCFDWIEFALLYSCDFLTSCEQKRYQS